jgi:hypothetical protein
MKLNLAIAIALIFASNVAHSQNEITVYMRCDVKLTLWMNESLYQTRNEQFDLEVVNSKGNTSVYTSTSSVGTSIKFDSKGVTKAYTRLANIKNYSSDSLLHYKYDSTQYGDIYETTEFKLHRFTGALFIDYLNKNFKSNASGDCKPFTQRLF